MIKAVIVSNAFDEDDRKIYTQSAVVPPVEGAYFEKYLHPERCFPQALSQTNYEARLDAEGKPYLHTQVVKALRPSYIEWCREGTNHRQEERILSHASRSEVRTELIFHRDMVRGRWVIDIDSIDQLEVLLREREGELVYEAAILPGIDFALRIYE